MDDQKNEKRYVNGYNDGYILSRYEPELIKNMMQYTPKDNPYFEGMAAGKTAQERDLFMENLQKQRAGQQTHKPKMK